MKACHKNKKGFTLVELIVVIAIIGVLAAILIPIMIGYVSHSRVSSANSVASELRKNINLFFTEADNVGYGMYVSDSKYCEPEVTVVNGVWTITINEDVSQLFKHSPTYQWTGSGSGSAGDPVNGISADSLLVISLASLFPEVENAYIKFRVQGGRCSALYFCTETTSPVASLPPFDDKGWSVELFNWDGYTQGVCSEGYVVGTAPVLLFG